MEDGNWTRELLDEMDNQRPKWKKGLRWVLVFVAVIILGITVWMHIKNQTFYSTFFEENYRWFEGNGYSQEFKGNEKLTIIHCGKKEKNSRITKRR